MMSQTTTRTRQLTDRFVDVRGDTEDLAAPLGAEDQTVQSMPDTSPTKWHRAHITWFFETFVLIEFDASYEQFDPAFGYLFNSYYEAVGARHPRPDRGLISRPTVSEVADYRAFVDAAMVTFLGTLDDESNRDILDLVELGLHHEQQHQELILMDIKHVLSVNPIEPSYRLTPVIPEPGVSFPLEWTSFDGGIFEIGHASGSFADSGFAYDNEGPRHEVLLRPYCLGNRLVTCGDWIDFINDRGYHHSNLWLSEGWFAAQKYDWNAPSYWFQLDGDWHMFTFDGVRPVDPSEPVMHVSHFEADAYARWADARLPLEAEWEVAAAGLDIVGNFADSEAFHARPASPSAEGLQQMFGDVWEWTSSPYVAYPGFAVAEGAVGEYNGKFMSNQMVLRGGCCATPPDHTRATYRNFFPSHTRWMFSGLRLAKDL
jgi:ergothioneine biosynthesis protein EgtB